MNADRECVARRHGQWQIRHMEFFTWQKPKRRQIKKSKNFFSSKSENWRRVDCVDGIFVYSLKKGLAPTTACLPDFSRRRNA